MPSIAKPTALIRTVLLEYVPSLGKRTPEDWAEEIKAFDNATHEANGFSKTKSPTVLKVMNVETGKTITFFLRNPCVETVRQWEKHVHLTFHPEDSKAEQENPLTQYIQSREQHFHDAIEKIGAEKNVEKMLHFMADLHVGNDLEELRTMVDPSLSFLPSYIDKNAITTSIAERFGLATPDHVNKNNGELATKEEYLAYVLTKNVYHITHTDHPDYATIHNDIRASLKVFEGEQALTWSEINRRQNAILLKMAAPDSSGASLARSAEPA